MSKTKLIIIFGLFVIFELVIRVGSYSRPINDRHSFRQSDTYSMILLLSEGKSDIFHPKFYQGSIYHYYLAEFPIYQASIAGMFSFTGENLILARLVNVVLFGLIAFTTFLIGFKLFGSTVGYFAAIVVGLFPSAFFWARAITPDVLGLAALTSSLAILIYVRSELGKRVSALLLAIAILTKPFYLLYFPVYFLLLSRTHKGNGLKETIRFLLLPTALLLMWRLWILSFPPDARADPDFVQLTTGGVGYLRYWFESEWWSIFLKDRLLGELLTPLGGMLTLAGLCFLPSVKATFFSRKFLYYWFGSSVAVVLLVARGSFVHDYYLIHLLPISSILVALGIIEIMRSIFRGGIRDHINNPLLAIARLLAVTLVVIYLGYLPFVKHLENFFSVELLGEEIMMQDYGELSRIIPEDEPVVTALPGYHPLPLNMIRRFGFIVDLSEDGVCSDETLRYYLDQNIHYFLDYYDENWSGCFGQNSGMFLKRVEEVYRGNRFRLYIISG